MTSKDDDGSNMHLTPQTVFNSERSLKTRNIPLIAENRQLRDEIGESKGSDGSLTGTNKMIDHIVRLSNEALRADASHANEVNVCSCRQS